MTNCCVICYKVCSLRPPTSSKNLAVEDVGGHLKEEKISLQRFFSFAERYLNELVQNDGKKMEEREKKLWKFPLEEVLAIGMIACPDCQRVMISFCKLYDELKRIELLLNWKLWTVKNLMACAQRVTPRVRSFKECVRKLEVEGSISSGNTAEEMIDLVIKSKRLLIDKCSHKLKNSLPRVSAVKWQNPAGPSNQHNTLVTMTVGLGDVIPDLSQNEANTSVSPLSIENGDYVPQLPGNSNLDNCKLQSVSAADDDTTLRDPLSHNPCMNPNGDGVPDKEFTQPFPVSERNALNYDAGTEVIDFGEFSEVGNGKSGEALEPNSSSKLPHDSVDDMGIEPNMDTSVAEESFKNEPTQGNDNHEKNDGIVSSSDQNEGHLSAVPSTATPKDLEHVEDANIPSFPNGGPRSETLPENIENYPASVEDNVGVGNENPQLCNKPTTSRRFLRTVHQCTNCRRTFSSKERLTNHQNECCNIFEDGEKDNGCAQAIEEEDEEMDIDNDEDGLGTDTTGTSDDDDESSYAEERERSEIGEAEMELYTDESSQEDEIDEQLQVHRKKTAKVKTSTSIIGQRSGDTGSGNNEKPWSCPDCSVSYNSQDSLRKHILLKHPVKWRELKNDRKYYPLPKHLGSSKKSTSGSVTAPVAYHFKCTNCNFMFPNMHSLLLHRQREHPSTSNTIEREKGRTTRVKMLSFTMTPISNRFTRTKYVQPFATLDVSDQGIFPCTKTYCRLPFYSQEDLDCHHKLHGKFQCQFCPVVKNFAQNLAEHELTHSKLIKQEPGTSTGEKLPVGKWECPRCANTFPNKFAYTAHHITAHLSLALIGSSCAICGTFSPLSKKLDLISHYKLHHDIEGVDPKSVKWCPLENCKAYFLNLSRLIHHARERHGANQKQLDDIIAKERQMYQCKDCNKKFATKSYRRAHRVKYHVEVENLLHCKAEKCKFVCETTQDLEHHSYYRHTFKRMEFIDCPKCSKACNGVAELKIHLRSHQASSTRLRRINRGEISNLKNTSRYRFKCPDCDLLFRDMDKLLLHRKGLHNGDNQTNTSVSDNTKITVEIISFPSKIVPASLDKAKVFKTFTKIQIADNVHVCPVSGCQLSFYSSSDLQIHSKLHGEFKCNFCDAVKEYAPEIPEHELIHYSNMDQIGSENSSWDCPRCKLKFQVTELYLSHHLVTHLNLVSLEGKKCRICGLSGSFSRRNSSLIRHYKNSHGLSDIPAANLHTCKEKDCGAYFVKRKALTTHIRLQHNKGEASSQRFKCKDCNSNKTYKNIYGLRNHRKTAHPTTHIFRCSVPKCSGSFETQIDLTSHIQHQHSSSKMDFVECPKCKKSFNGTGLLRRHMIIHDREEQGLASVSRFVCETCGKIWSSKANLETHSLSHSGPESWKFSCSVCSKKCMTHQKLDEHKRTHSNEKPFVCQICGQKYAHRHNLRIHFNNKHGDVTEDRPTIIRKRKPESSIVGTSNKRKRKRKPHENRESDYDTY